MQSCRDLLFLLHQRGIRLWVEKGELRFHGPAGALGPELRAELRKFRTEIIGILEQEERSVEDIPLLPRPDGCRVPLTAMQRRRWNNRHIERRYRLRTGVIATRVVGSFSVLCLRAALDTLVVRHESLRTRFVDIDRSPWQTIDLPYPAELEIIDLTELPASEREPARRRMTEAFLAEEVDFSVGPLFSSKLFQLSDKEHVLVIALNHMISDGVSNEIIRQELWSFYRQCFQEHKPSLPPLSLQFADYAVWQQMTHEAWMRAHAPYWLEKLSDAPIVKFPTDIGLPQTSSARAMARITLGVPVSAELRRFAQRQQCLLSLVVLTLYVTLVSQWCGQKDLVTRLIMNSRYRPELSNMVGFLANHLYLRIRLDNECRFLDSLNHVQQEFYTAFDHMDFDRVPDLVPECHQTDLCFNWASEFRWYFERPQETVGNLTLKPFECHPARVLNFMPFLYDDEREISGWIEYRNDRFSAETIRRFEADLRCLAETCMRDPDASVTSVLTLRGHVTG